MRDLPHLHLNVNVKSEILADLAWNEMNIETPQMPILYKEGKVYYGQEAIHRVREK